MRIMMLCEAESGGGAMRSAYRLLTALRQAGHEAVMRARAPVTDNSFVMGPRSHLGRTWTKIRRRLDALPLHAYPQREPAFFSPAWLPDQIADDVARWRPDVVHVQWINNGFISVNGLARIRAPQVWSLHDSWAFTGGCHYHVTCERFTSECGACPALASSRETDLSRRIFQRKKSAWADIKPQLIAPSRWMASRAARATLTAQWPVSIIANPLDCAVFKPADRGVMRKHWNLPLNRRVVLFSALYANDRNKGWDLLQAALRLIIARFPDLILATVGHPPAEGYRELDLPIISLGPIADETAMASINSAVDVVAIPSRCESFSYSVLEAQACGAVPVAFRVGGIPDLIDHQSTGWLAEPFSVPNFAEGLEWALAATPTEQSNLVARAQRYSIDLITAQHLAVYRRMISQEAT